MTMPAESGPAKPSVALADDLLRGAGAIAEFIYGDAKYRRKIYHLVETSRLPVSRIGSHIFAHVG